MPRANSRRRSKASKPPNGAAPAAQEQLEAERARLENGESTPFEVLQRERDLVEAEQQKIVAQQTYHNSVTSLNRAQGTTLRVRNIAVEDAFDRP